MFEEGNIRTENNRRIPNATYMDGEMAMGTVVGQSPESLFGDEEGVVETVAHTDVGPVDVENDEYNNMTSRERFLKTVIEALVAFDNIEIDRARCNLERMIERRKATEALETQKKSETPQVDKAEELMKVAKDFFGEDYGVSDSVENLDVEVEAVGLPISGAGEVLPLESSVMEQTTPVDNTQYNDMTPGERLIHSKIEYDAFMDRIDAELNRKMLDHIIKERKATEALEAQKKSETPQVDYAAELIKAANDFLSEDYTLSGSDGSALGTVESINDAMVPVITPVSGVDEILSFDDEPTKKTFK